MRNAATKRGSRVKPRSQTGRSRSSNGELVMQTLRTFASSRQRVMKSSTFHLREVLPQRGQIALLHIEPERVARP